MRQVEGRDHNTEKRGKTSPRRCPRRGLQGTTTPVALTAAGRTDPPLLGPDVEKTDVPKPREGWSCQEGARADHRGQIPAVAPDKSLNTPMPRFPQL